jgi:hypothetical protein
MRALTETGSAAGETLISLYRSLAVPAHDRVAGSTGTMETRRVETVDNDCSLDLLLRSNNDW